MKRAILILVLMVCSLPAFAEQKEKKEQKTKLLESLNLNDWNLEIKKSEAQVQEEVSVEADEYPGLNISVSTPVESLGIYKPYTKQELRAYSDLLTDYNLNLYDASGTARPHNPGRLFQVRQ